MRFLLQKWGSSDEKYFPLHQESKVNLLFLPICVKATITTTNHFM